VRRSFAALALLLGCTPVAEPGPFAPRAECSAVPSVLSFSRDAVRIREGLTTSVVPLETTEYPGLHHAFTDLREDTLRPACDGTPEILQADDDLEGVSVLIAIGALSRGCEAAVQVLVDASPKPVPVFPIYFCGCMAALPPRHCQGLTLEVREDAAVLTRKADLVPGPDCDPGENPMLSVDSPQPPEAPPPQCDTFETVDAAVKVANGPSKLSPCDRLWVSFYGDRGWKQMREVLRAARPLRRHVVASYSEPDAEGFKFCGEARPSEPETRTR
jgi:hypothetical protein